MNTNLKIKICGITNLPDAQLVDSFRPDYLGMVLHPQSKRCIMPDTLVEVLSWQTYATKVLVFGFDSAEFIIQCCTKYQDYLGRIYFQFPALHDQFDIIVQELKKYISVTQMIPAYNVSCNTSDQDLMFLSEFPLVLLDSAHSQNGIKLAGGSGKSFDWNNIAQVQRPFLLAGGLTAENVIPAKQNTHAVGFDVAGGTEKSYGIKDPDKVRLFIQAVREG